MKWIERLFFKAWDGERIERRHYWQDNNGKLKRANEDRLLRELMEIYKKIRGKKL